MSRTLAIHWSATTYGTWLHGDQRGSLYCGQLIGPDPELETASRAAMKHNAVVLSAQERRIVAHAIGSTVLQEGYRVLAATIQPMHLHLLFAPLCADIKQVVAELKYRSANAVISDRANRRVPGPRSLWTTGRFPVFIFTKKHLLNAIEYIRDHNRRVGLPADPFDWIDPLYPPSKIAGERIDNDTGLALPIW